MKNSTNTKASLLTSALIFGLSTGLQALAEDAKTAPSEPAGKEGTKEGCSGKESCSGKDAHAKSKASCGGKDAKKKKKKSKASCGGKEGCGTKEETKKEEAK